MSNEIIYENDKIRIERTTYEGKRAIVKKLKIKIDKKKSKTLSQIHKLTKNKLKTKVLNLQESTEKEALNQLDCFNWGSNIVEIYDYDEKKGEIYMKEYQGDLVKLKADKLNFRNKYFIVLDILRGLKTIHDLYLVHSDIKCENIFYEKDYFKQRYVAYIADFGASNDINGDIEEYTRQFKPNDKTLTEKFDIFSLGKTIVEFFCNLKDCDFNILDYSKFPLFIKLSDFDNYEAFYNLVRRSLRRNPEERPSVNEYIRVVIFYLNNFSKY